MATLVEAYTALTKILPTCVEAIARNDADLDSAGLLTVAREAFTAALPKRAAELSSKLAVSCVTRGSNGLQDEQPSLPLREATPISA